MQLPNLNRFRWLPWLLFYSVLPSLRALAADADLEIPPEVKLPSLWVKTVDAKTWSGFKDNVLLANRNAIESSFLAGNLDATLLRLPIDEWEALVFASGEYTRYFNSQKVDQESTAVLQGQLKRSIDSWKLGLSAEYLYFNQVFDNSIVSTQFIALPVQGHGFTLRPSVQKSLGNNYSLNLEVPATRQIFGQLIDDYWEAGPKLALTRQLGAKSDLSIAYQDFIRRHDTRLARDSNGLLLQGKRLQFYQQEIYATWRQSWTEQSHWRTATRLSLERNDDNGGGYYAFWRPALSEQLRYQAKSWEIRAEARLSYYQYDSQRIDATNSPIRQKTYVRLNLRAEKELSKSFKVFAQYEHERALSNLGPDEYSVNTISAGLDWHF